MPGTVILLTDVATRAGAPAAWMQGGRDSTFENNDHGLPQRRIQYSSMSDIFRCLTVEPLILKKNERDRFWQAFREAEYADASVQL